MKSASRHWNESDQENLEEEKVGKRGRASQVHWGNGVSKTKITRTGLGTLQLEGGKFPFWAAAFQKPRAKSTPPKNRTLSSARGENS